LCGRRGRRRRGNGDVWAHRIELFLADAADSEQVFDAVKTAALLTHVDNSLRSDRPYAGQFLKFFCVRDVKIDWLRGRMFLRADGDLQKHESKGQENNYSARSDW
jgi:hypothetical protein